MKIKRLLKLLIISVILKQLVWIALVPMWQFPDEQAHFGQVAYTFDKQLIKPTSNLTQEILITERILQTERDWAGNNKYTYHPEYNIPYTNSYIGRHEQEIKTLPLVTKITSSIQEATSYPPVYYVPLGLIYKFFFNYDILVRLFLVRLFNIIFSLLTLLIGYKLFTLVFEKEFIALCASILFSFQPMFSFLQGGINSDNLFNLIFVAGIYLSLLFTKRVFSIKKLLLAAGLYVSAIYTKPQGYLLIPIFFFPLLFRLVTNKSFKFGFKIFLLFLVVIVPIYFRLMKGRQFLPEVYPETILKPELTFLEHLKWTLNHSVREVLPWFWGVFRWLSLALPQLVNRLINRSLLILIFGLFLYILRIFRKKDFSFRTISLTFFIYATIIYFMVITFWDYLFTITHGYSFGIQGRYFYPILSAITGLLTFGILGYAVKEKIQRILLSIFTSLMIVLHEITLFRVVFSYFSTSSLAKFFMQASQYKPWFFKSPILQFIFIIHFISLVVLVVNLLSSSLAHEKN
ncbi:MAG: DUF2142 domain-containing protein [Candidatus Omnitrophica bacterium]|nr:DUF2142 domain-containing protein [Candidatus Omnitrophota bacterium]